MRRRRRRRRQERRCVFALVSSDLDLVQLSRSTRIFWIFLLIALSFTFKRRRRSNTKCTQETTEVSSTRAAPPSPPHPNPLHLLTPLSLPSQEHPTSNQSISASPNPRPNDNSTTRGSEQPVQLQTCPHRRTSRVSGPQTGRAKSFLCSWATWSKGWRTAGWRGYWAYVVESCLLSSPLLSSNERP